MIKLIKVVSGGQTGVDQAALFAAERAGYQTGGWAPHNWMTDTGPDPDLLRDRFGLIEHSGGYKARTIENVQDSDATLVLATDFGSPGTALTIRTARAQQKPCFPSPYLSRAGGSVGILVSWLSVNNVEILNVAGHRQTMDNNIFQLASEVLDKMFALVRVAK